MKKAAKEILDKKFILVTGKGGTGKSVFATALALHLSNLGKKVHLAEIGRNRDNAFMRLNELLYVESLEHKLRRISVPGSPGVFFHASRVSPEESLLEYATLKLRSQRLTKLLLKNRVTAAFLDVVPGVSDIVCLGKLWNELVGEKSKSPPDTIILDAPSSGHALSMLLAPQNFSRLTKAGPLFSDATAMAHFFSNPRQSSIIYCAIPEELPLQETREFSSWIAGKFPPAHVVVNKCFSESPPWNTDPLVESAEADQMADSPILRAWHYGQRRSKSENSILAQFRAEFPHALFLPYIFPSAEKWQPTLAIAQKIHAGWR